MLAIAEIWILFYNCFIVLLSATTGGPEAVAASKDLRAALVAAKVHLASSKGFVGRFFSIKAAHGIIMFVSWINIAGRLGAFQQGVTVFTNHGEW